MSSVQDLYRQLFGRSGTQKGTDIDMSEHGRVGGLSTGQPFKFVSNIDGTIPTSGNNPSLVLGYTGTNLTTIQKTIGSTTYTKTLTYSGNVLISISAWV